MISEMDAAADLMRRAESERGPAGMTPGVLGRPVASVLDLGSNSVKLSHYMVDAHNDFKLYYQRSVRLNLFEGLRDGMMRAKYIDLTVDTLKLFREKTIFEGADHVVAVATSAIRDAHNRDEIVDRIRQETGFDFKVLSDTDEACYSYAGAIRMLHLPSTLFFDIGGGSLETVVARNYNIERAISLPLGALRLTQRFARDAKYREVDFDSMEKHIKKNLPDPGDLGIRRDDALAAGGDGRGGDRSFAMVGVGGALRSLTKYIQEKKRYPLSKIHNYQMSTSDLEVIWRKIRDMPPAKIAKISAIGAGRADTIRAAVLVVLLFVKGMGVENLTVSAHGLREGALALSMQHPAAFKSQRIGHQHIRETILSSVSPAAALVSSKVEGLVDMLLSAKLLRTTDRPILHYALEQTDRLNVFRDASNILHMVMDDDSHLSHGDQLLAALAVMDTRKRRKADTSMLNLESVAGPYDKKWVRRISAIISMYNILNRLPVRMTPELGRGGSITLVVSLKQKGFPELMFREACKKMEDVFGVPFTGIVRSPA